MLCNNGCCQECSTCASKPGSPALCSECLRRRGECNALHSMPSRVLTPAELQLIERRDQARSAVRMADDTTYARVACLQAGDVPALLAEVRRLRGIGRVPQAKTSFADELLLLVKKHELQGDTSLPPDVLTDFLCAYVRALAEAASRSSIAADSATRFAHLDERRAQFKKE